MDWDLQELINSGAASHANTMLSTRHLPAWA